MINTDCVHGNNSYQTNDFPLVNIVTSNTSSVAGLFYQRYYSQNAQHLGELLKKLYKTDKNVAIFESGMMAINIMVEYFAKPKQRIIVPDTLYCEVKNLFALPLMDYDFCYINMHDMDKLKQSLNDNTALVFLDNPSNPLYDEYDLKGICDIVHSYNKDIRVAVDNTIFTAYYCNPLEYGADIVLESLGKNTDGHCDAMGGMILYDDFTNDSVYNIDALASLRGRYISPFACYLIERGIKTLPLRMERMTKTAGEVYKYLKTKTPYVKWCGKGGLITFSINGGANRHRYFVEHTKMIFHGTAFGATNSLIQTSYSHFDKDLPIPYNEHLRLSVGLEDAEDIIADLEKVFQSYESNYQKWLTSRC